MEEKELKYETLANFLFVRQDLPGCLIPKDEPQSDSGEGTEVTTVPSLNQNGNPLASPESFISDAAPELNARLENVPSCTAAPNPTLNNNFPAFLDTQTPDPGSSSMFTDGHDTLLPTPMSSLDNKNLQHLSSIDSANNNVTFSPQDSFTPTTSSRHQSLPVPPFDSTATGPARGSFSLKPSAHSPHSPFFMQPSPQHSTHSQEAASHPASYHVTERTPQGTSPLPNPNSPPSLPPLLMCTQTTAVSSDISHPTLPLVQANTVAHTASRSGLPLCSHNVNTDHSPAHNVDSFNIQDGSEKHDEPSWSNANVRSQNQGKVNANGVASSQPGSVGSNHSDRNSVNGVASPIVSDCSESGDSMFSPIRNAQSYANLTPWTSKLTAQNYLPMEAPLVDSLPFPFDINKESALLLSPRAGDPLCMTEASRMYQGFSRLQPVPSFYTSSDCPLDNSNLENPLLSSTVQRTSRLEETLQNGGVEKLEDHELSNNNVEPFNVKSNYKVLPNKERRFKRTADALQKSGLWEVAMRTGTLMRRNRELQKELEQFRSDALVFLKSVIKNPENRNFIKNILNSALSGNTNNVKNVSPVMTVVVSAAAAAAAASAKLDSEGSSDASSISGNASDGGTSNSSHSSEYSSDAHFLGPDKGRTGIMAMELD